MSKRSVSMRGVLQRTVVCPVCFLRDGGYLHGTWGGVSPGGRLRFQLLVASIWRRHTFSC